MLILLQESSKLVVLVHMISDTLPSFLNIVSVALETAKGLSKSKPDVVLLYYMSAPSLAAELLTQQYQTNSRLLRRIPRYESGELAQQPH